MYVRSLDLRDFRSWRSLHVDLTPGVTVFVGRNGHGKTNVVEAIGYVAHLGSHRVHHDSALVRAGASSARISATAVNEGRELTAHLLIRPHQANQAQINRARCKSPREIVGIVKTVLFAPEDLALVRGEPAERRSYLDQIVATRTPRLAGVKADYEKALRQRNALLKSAAAVLRRGYESDEGASALATLDVWDAQLARLGAQLLASRLQLVEQLREHVVRAYHTLAPESRRAQIVYRSTAVPQAAADTPVEVLEASLLAAFANKRAREIERGLTLVGPHRDDCELLLGAQPAKGFASHGESWSFALALRLGAFTLLRADGTDPVLILDDVFAELDARRRRALVDVVKDAEQVLITAAVGDDLPPGLADLAVTRHSVSMVEAGEQPPAGGVADRAGEPVVPERVSVLDAASAVGAQEDPAGGGAAESGAEEPDGAAGS